MDRFVGKSLDKSYGEDGEFDCEQGLLAADDRESSHSNQTSSPIPNDQMVTINLN